jgi:hypothetical protein
VALLQSIPDRVVGEAVFEYKLAVGLHAFADKPERPSSMQAGDYLFG